MAESLPALPPRADVVPSPAASALAKLQTVKEAVHIPTVREVLAFNPAKSLYRTVVPFILNKESQLGEDTPAARARSLERIQLVSTWLDAKYKIPFTKYKIGLDPLVSAVPYVGDVVSTAMSCYIVYLTRRFHVPWHITAKMVWNVMLNATFGAIPVLGSAFDIAYKPNMRNLILLEEFLRKEAIKAGQDPKVIDEALRRSRAEIISFHEGESGETRPLLADGAEQSKQLYPNAGTSEDVPAPPLPSRG
ncbi:uncharacterized protein SPPG_08793 [Spizellomyces punctatus DAOM BR117]|uniref:DUF4112 domain-containing protein n=1 Tax=Spizellomyces punctatus (strain DAOM BR117) TaxID=645134 RepID=A0A0L0H2X2_SPIPD|nr:uncharacterized protein SPPG_08793 [Spizellomyces punctatus DAOM BR117]KNC95800.1 hypothetical protein SPPG_08793 [Spizellomyces punctatus DAOM BR117]|eukprot:XP_016603840.1 hypothetical protein SPPG_08793 [Spizellomyces punctatus DAOM BR117]